MNKIIEVVSFIAVISLIAKIFGAGRELTLSYCFGTSSLSDAYLLATTIPVTIFSFIYESIAAGFIPACSKINGKQDQSLFTSKVINSVSLITLFIVVLIEIFPEFTIKLFASGFTEDTLALSSEILRISIIGVFFTAISNILVAYHNFNNSFLIATARAIPLDIIVIVSIFLGYYLNSVVILAIGIPVSVAISTVFIIPETKKLGFHYTPSFDFNDKNVKNLISWSLPVIISTALFDINSIVDRQFASYLCVGGISIITYSSRLISLFTSLLILPVLTFLFPNFTKTIQRGENEEANRLYINVLRHLLLLTIPFVFVILGFSTEIAEIVFKRGAFGEDDAILTGNCLLFYSFTVIAFAISSLATRFFYADTDMWTPLKISFAGVIINVTGDFALSGVLGLQGLALASSVSLLFTAIVQHVVLSKKRNIRSQGFLIYILMLMGASGISMLTLLMKIFFISLFGMFAGTVFLIITFVVILCISLKIFGIPEINSYLKILKIENK